MKKIYLIGYPIKHSKSPALHNAWLKNLGLDQQIKYELCEIDKLNFETNIQAILNSQNFLGANITVPYKTKIIKYLDDLSAEAREIGAVNTICRTRSKLTGHNTDALGFKADLDKNKINYKSKNILILGAGGAAKACSYILKDFAKHIGFYYRGIFNKKYPGPRSQNQHAKKDSMLEKSNSSNHTNSSQTNAPVAWIPDISPKFRDDRIDLIINCTPLGLNHTDPLPIDQTILENLIKQNKSLIIYDLIYKHKQTKLMQFVSLGKSFNGSGMLQEQAALSFKLWTNISPL